MTDFLSHKVDDEAAADWPAIHKEAARYTRALISVISYSEKAELSYRQIKWFKGVLLPALWKDSGDTILWWENELKTKVMPEKFQPEVFRVDGEPHATLPSITILSMADMNLFIPGCVDHLRNKCHLEWVTLPDPELRSV